MGALDQLHGELVRPAIAAPVRYAEVMSVQSTDGTVTVRPSNAVLADGTQDITARFLTPVAPGVGASVRIETFQGDVVVTGAPGVDDFPTAPFGFAAGTVNVVMSGSSSGTTALTFPSGRFTVAPIITLTKVSASGSAVALVPQAVALSASGMTVGLYAANSVAVAVTVAVHWTATQMTSTSAAG